jgi:hypothetical protein
MSLRKKLNLMAIILVAALLSVAALTPTSLATAASAEKGITAPITGTFKNPQTGAVVPGSFAGEIEITGLKLAPDRRGLLLSGEVRGKADVPGQSNNRQIKQAFKDVPANLLRGAPRAQVVDDDAALSYRIVPDVVGGAAEVQQAQTCDILTLLIPGGIFLDLLGLQLIIAPIAILLQAVAGAGNLLGNLLCAIAGLLDP